MKKEFEPRPVPELAKRRLRKAEKRIVQLEQMILDKQKEMEMEISRLKRKREAAKCRRDRNLYFLELFHLRPQNESDQ